jgi:hypothetical protein
MELLIDRLETLINADVSKEEVLRQLKQKKPNLGKGDVLRRAEVLVGQNGSQRELTEAHEYLKNIMSLENSYITSTGNLGTTRDYVTVWDHPKKPLRMVGLMVLLSFVVIGAISYMLGAPDGFLIFLLMAGVPVSIIVSMERAVINNKWRARQELDEKILRNAKSFEAMLEKVYR